MLVVLVFKLIRRPAGAVRGAGAAAGASMGGKHGAMMSMGAFSPARFKPHAVWLYVCPEPVLANIRILP